MELKSSWQILIFFLGQIIFRDDMNFQIQFHFELICANVEPEVTWITHLGWQVSRYKQILQCA